MFRSRKHMCYCLQGICSLLERKPLEVCLIIMLSHLITCIYHRLLRIYIFSVSIWVLVTVLKFNCGFVSLVAC